MFYSITACYTIEHLSLKSARIGDIGPLVTRV
nr:MAG TPA: hypothetical protein [Caudoviricetes sp.]